MNEGQTHNINTYMEWFRGQPFGVNRFDMARSNRSLNKRFELLCGWASSSSQGAFTTEQCAEVIRSWKEYKDAVQRLSQQPSTTEE